MKATKVFGSLSLSLFAISFIIRILVKVTATNWLLVITPFVFGAYFFGMFSVYWLLDSEKGK